MATKIGPVHAFLAPCDLEAECYFKLQGFSPKNRMDVSVCSVCCYLLLLVHRHKYNFREILCVRANSWLPH